MASSKKPAANKRPVSTQQPESHPYLTQQIQNFLAGFFSRHSVTQPQLLLALSGGLDSIVLLHLLTQIKPNLPFHLSAMHVHHGLSANADTWAQFCTNVCEQWQVPLTITRVQVESKGLGLEAAARAARYQALSKSPTDFICLAHHQDDQAETLLLQLARGAGVRGLAAMAPYDGGRKLLRPLLSCTRADLMAYAQLHRLNWIEDESNADTHYDRNFMRHQFMPSLKQRYPAITQTLARSASHFAATASLCDDLAEIDAREAVENNHLRDTIDLQKMKHLSYARQVNLLRWWLAQYDLSMPSTAQMQQILQQLFHAAADAAIAIKLSENRMLKRYRQHAYLVKASPIKAWAINGMPMRAVISPATINLVWQDEPELILPDQSRLIFMQGNGMGLALRAVAGQVLTVRCRQGGEVLKPESNQPGRSLKTLFNGAGVPPWLRPAWPLLFVNEQLAMVPNIATDAQFKAAKDESALQVDWVDAEGHRLWPAS